MLFFLLKRLVYYILIIIENTIVGGSLRVFTIKNYGVENIILPDVVFGNFLLEYKDSNSNTDKLVNIGSENGKWKLLKDDNIKITHNNVVCDECILELYKYYFLELMDKKENIILYCEPTYRENILEYSIVADSTISIGKSNDNDITINNNIIGEKAIILNYKDKMWSIENVLSSIPVFVNGDNVRTKVLHYGDQLFLMGTTVIFMKDIVIVNGMPNTVIVNHKFEILKKKKLEYKIVDEELELYSKEDYFSGSPRLKPGINKITVAVDNPPEKEKDEEKPLLYVLGPMLTMGMMSMVTAYSAFSGIINKTQTIKSSLPTLLIALAMLSSMVLWPSLSRRYEKKQKIKREKKRKDRYFKYLDDYKQFVSANIESQEKILNENYLSAAECTDMLNKRKNELWSIKINNPDFLNIRVGMGNLPLYANITYPETHFSLEDDDLRDAVSDLINNLDELHNVPITVSLTDKNILGIINEKGVDKGFVDSLLAQLATMYGYFETKIVFFTTENNSHKWEYLKKAPHCWNNEKNIRFFAANDDEYKELSFYLEQVFQSRKYKEMDDGRKENNLNYKNYRPYYVIFTDNYKEVKHLEVIKNILAQELNIGFSIIVLSNNVTTLPKECKNFIYADREKAGMFESELLENNQKSFKMEYLDNADLKLLFIALSNIPIEYDDNEGTIPQAVGFLEMYQVGKIEQLNIVNRWQNNNSTTSLQAILGLGKGGELFKLDLHEKFHGPHGLIAGMTGSGKSELIITYILSMAVNYSPNEVSFILIDYKGGGLAGVFNQPDNGIVLPHLAGTITNLDSVEMNRALVSIQSELRRRQRVFNEARNKLGESSIDIYKYQRLFKEGKLEKPVSHLFIICDEFAELKQQQPEFMEQLISTARIGRSLGVHLILATQKPAGIVDDQIWSNSKFRICLKVQEKSDSMEVIKCPDAAALKDVGRFYLQVGYNELFAIGQSAWCGGEYVPSDKPKKKADNSLMFIDNIGNIVKSIDNPREITTTKLGEEIKNILKHIIEISQRENLKADRLWLNPIPGNIYVSELEKKYNYVSKPKIIEPVIGEYDDPSNQRQGLLTLKLSEEGNTILYGSPGSGKENLLSTIIYSTIIEHDANEVNFYIVDFGAESLKVFQNAPQVGDVVLASEEEKLNKLFKMLYDKVEERKNLLASFNGDYKSCVNKGNKSLPLIVVIINNYDAFYEMYEDIYYGDLLKLSRDANRYGIVFILSVSGTNSLRYKLRQNFNRELALQFNDENDYITILGPTGGIKPSNFIGRGLVKLDELYEFQTAYSYKVDFLSDYFKIVCDKLKNKAVVKANPIPILPKEVTYDCVKDYTKSLIETPIGISEQKLTVEKYDFQNHTANIISALDIADTQSFINSLIYEFNQMMVSISIYDMESLIVGPTKANYYRDNISTQIYQIHEYLDKMLNTGNNVNIKHLICIVIGIDKFIKKCGLSDINVFFGKVKEWKHISFIFVDSDDKFKIYEYETWYKSIFDSGEGIWIGNGAMDQFVVRITKNTRIVEDEISSEFGYVVRRGNPTKIKLISFGDDDSDGDDVI